MSDSKGSKLAYSRKMVIKNLVISVELVIIYYVDDYCCNFRIIFCFSTTLVIVKGELIYKRTNELTKIREEIKMILFLNKMKQDSYIFVKKK